MAAKKRTKNRKANALRSAGNKVTPMKQKVKKKLVKKKIAKKNAAREGAAVKAKAVSTRTSGGNAVAAFKKPVRRRSQSVDTVPSPLERPVSRSSGQSGDLQGLSNVESVDSESVNELLEEGNAFEADVVMGVEDAGDAEEREVRTHEVPEDDVPGEYLDKE